MKMYKLLIWSLLWSLFHSNVAMAKLNCSSLFVSDQMSSLKSTVLVREHRGSLEQSLETEVEIKKDMNSLISLIRLSLGRLDINERSIEVEYYGYDKRLDRETYMIKVEGHPFGFSDGYIPVPKAMLN